jgi:hypothetical protein
VAERDKKGRFVKGHKKLFGAGRKKGTPNKATKAWKEFVTALVSDTDNQKAFAKGESLHRSRQVGHTTGVGRPILGSSAKKRPQHEHSR